LPTLLGGCCAGGVLLLYVPMFVSVMKEAYGN
jgi:hypothetical protein